MQVIVRIRKDVEAMELKLNHADAVYTDMESTETIYVQHVKPLLASFELGYNVTIFAYGQTGAGKTYTMLGENGDGIIPRVVRDVMQMKKKVTLAFSYLEVLREMVFDLLTEKDENVGLNIRQDIQLGVVVYGLVKRSILNMEDMEKYLKIGNTKRAKASTGMNTESSRSHAICTLYMEQDTSKNTKLVSKLHLVDLAGSERVKKANTSDKKLKQGIFINKGLLALGNVIKALTSKANRHVPYRDSKLTRILQDSLGGNSLTMMIACVSPKAEHRSETNNTIRYAMRAKNIHNKAVVNEIGTDAKRVLQKRQPQNSHVNVLQTVLVSKLLQIQRLQTGRMDEDLDCINSEKSNWNKCQNSTDIKQLKSEYQSNIAKLEHALEHDAQQNKHQCATQLAIAKYTYNQFIKTMQARKSENVTQTHNMPMLEHKTQTSNVALASKIKGGLEKGWQLQQKAKLLQYQLNKSSNEKSLALRKEKMAKFEKEKRVIAQDQSKNLNDVCRMASSASSMENLLRILLDPESLSAQTSTNISSIIHSNRDTSLNLSINSTETKMDDHDFSNILSDESVDGSYDLSDADLAYIEDDFSEESNYNDDSDYVNSPYPVRKKSKVCNEIQTSNTITTVPELMLEGCHCKGKCATRACECKLNKTGCTPKCKCKVAKCINGRASEITNENLNTNN